MANTPPAPQDGIWNTLSYRYDAISVYEGINYLFKKSLGYPNTLPQGSLYGEYTRGFNSFSFINRNKIYNQFIPQSNLSFNNYIFDPTFSNVNFRYPTGTPTVINDLESTRYYCSNFPYIAYYSNILLTNMAQNSGSYGSLQTVSYGHPLLVNAIPITLVPYPGTTPGGYPTTLLTSNIGSQAIINERDGYWLVDTDSGIITLYDSNTTAQLGPIRNNDGTIAGFRLPRISFYRYEGLIGSTNVANTQDF
jgi:hypothetical protein